MLRNVATALPPPQAPPAVGLATRNKLFFGDNLQILRDHIADETVDLIYLDPPFNSNADYNILFREASGAASHAQIKAFGDTWHWGPIAEETYNELVTSTTARMSEVIQAFRKLVGSTDMMAYLCMMAIRLIELQRVLKPTGSLYLHCDPNASHYLKLLLDAIFGPLNFRNEVIWKRTSSHSDARRYGRIHDVLLFYSKGDMFTWNPQPQKVEFTEVRGHDILKGEDGRAYRLADATAAHGGPSMLYEWQGRLPPKGRYWAYSRDSLSKLEADGRLIYNQRGHPRIRRFLDELPGIQLQDLWTDVGAINSAAKERLGYDTQKPLALLERILLASSNPGDVVLDPFCGCGSAVDAAQRLNRAWIGIDITHLAVSLMKYRLADRFGGAVTYEVVGEPVDVESARALAARDRYQFQFWALSLLAARPEPKDEKRGRDRGIDGVIHIIEGKGEARAIVVQVKSGHVSSSHIRDLVGVLDREKAAMGLFITLDPPSREMTLEATKAGFYRFPLTDKRYPRVQLRTIEQLLIDKVFELPPRPVQFTQAQRYVETPEQEMLPLGPIGMKLGKPSVATRRTRKASQTQQDRLIR
jgi:site-specific DNA-methyltransferase (adenine-specific)